MNLTELIGKKITQIYGDISIEVGGDETADCFIELDESMIIGFPWFTFHEVCLRELPLAAEALLWADGRNEPAFGRKILDFVWYEDADYGVYILLDDGALIYETRTAFHGTGNAGLRMFNSIKELEEHEGSGYKQWIG